VLVSVLSQSRSKKFGESNGSDLFWRMVLVGGIGLTYTAGVKAVGMEWLQNPPSCDFDATRPAFPLSSAFDGSLISTFLLRISAFLELRSD